jgi:hypothetical protein
MATQTHRGVMRAISGPVASQSQTRDVNGWTAQGRRHAYESLSGSWTWTQARDMAATRTWRGASGYLATTLSRRKPLCASAVYEVNEQTGQWPGYD